MFTSASRAAGTPLEDAWVAAQLPTTDDFGRRFPHQLSGGQQQRVAIAMALVCKPSVIVMDEPTTGLDVLTQERLLRVIREIRTQRESCIVYISHDLGVVRNLVDHVAVMYGGRIVEHAPVDELFRAPRHPYTRRLLEAIPRVHRSTGTVRGIAGRAVEPWNRPAGCPFAPRCDYRIERCDQEMPPQIGDTRHSARCWRVDELPAPDETPAPVTEKAAVAVSPAPRSEPLLDVRELVAGYRVVAVGCSAAAGSERSPSIVSRSSYSREAASRLSARAVAARRPSRAASLGSTTPFAGELVYQGRTLPGLARRRDPDLRRRIQIVFQDPDSSLNPSMTVGAIVGRPLVHFFDLGRTEVGRRVA